ncbi:ATP-binding cassette domain-containing protein [Pollutimonas nitritireducens]|uniref:ATP-binding cassette domain-containing protein n=1 Tax=Pollutimonas nitritireducens TaxID=2045209 RepID=UPI003F706B00
MRRVLRKQEHGYETVVGERGATLSGGQRQRVGIARAFLKDAPILILDEATAALDSRSERDVHRALQRLMEGRTVIAVAHRLSTLDGFDRIIMLSAGRIVQDGNPADLRRRDGLYSALWQIQTGQEAVIPPRTPLGGPSTPGRRAGLASARKF